MDAHALLLAKTQAMTEQGRKALSLVLQVGASSGEGARAAHDQPTVASGAHASDPAEAIHDLRVALRRLRTVLRPMRIVYGKRALAVAESRLRAILDLTSELRDEEVLRETLNALSLKEGVREPLERWMEGRARRERGFRNRATRALSGGNTTLLDAGVGVCLDELEAKVSQGPKHVCALETFQRGALGRALDDLDERVETSNIDDSESMHRVRIGAKRLRYVAELLGELVNEAASIAFLAGTVADPTIKRARTTDLRRLERSSTRIQKRLGHLHDLDEALQRMGRAWGLDKGPRASVLKALMQARQVAAHKSSTELSEELARIRVASARLLDGPANGTDTLSVTRPHNDAEEDAAS